MTGLFDPEAFEQMPGQMSMDQVEPYSDVQARYDVLMASRTAETVAEPKLRKHTVFMPCKRHETMYASESRSRRAEVMVEGGWADSPCVGNGCRMKPGTDFYTASFVAAHPRYYTVGDES